MSNSNPPALAAPPAPAPAVQAIPFPLANKWVMVLISFVALAAMAVWGVFLVNSIPLVSALPEGVNSPLEYVLKETAASFAVPVAVLGLAGAILNLAALVADKLKLWLEFFIKLSALCAIIYTSSLVFAAANR